MDMPGTAIQTAAYAVRERGDATLFTSYDCAANVHDSETTLSIAASRYIFNPAARNSAAAEAGLGSNCHDSTVDQSYSQRNLKRIQIESNNSTVN
jgi:hypothetical protein